MEWKLKDLTVDGKGSYGIGAPAVPYQEDKLTYLRITDINDDGSLNFSDLKSVDAEDAEKYILKENDIVFARTGNSTGRSYFYEKQHGTFVYAGFLIKFSLDPNKVNPRILKYYTHSKPYFDWVNSFDTGATRGNINAKTYGDMEIELPSRKVQDKIVSILSSLDRKIELNNKINADLEEMAQAIFKNWFVDFEPFKDGKFVDSELGMIPEGWKVGCLEDLITIKYGKDHKKLDDGTFPVYGSGGLMRFVNSWLYNGESVLIPRKGTLDNIMYVCEKFWTVDTMFFSVPKMDYVMKYVYNYIKRFDFSKMNEGTSVPSNTAARLNKMPILIPTHEILEMYDETLCPIYNKRKMKDKESRILSLLRDTLLPRLMSGELEVPE